MKFKELHTLNWVFLIVTLILIGLNIVRYINYAPWERTYYTVGIGAPNLHPVQVSAYFTNRSGHKLYLRDDRNSFWGRAYTSDDEMEFKALPDSLYIKWIALREREIYKGAFKLSVKKINAVLKSRHFKKRAFERYNSSPVSGYSFIVGIAPGGSVTVWMEGRDDCQKEIAQFQAKKTDHYLANASRQESIDYALDKMHETANAQRDSVMNNNLPPETNKWDLLRKQFSYYIWLDALPDINTLKSHFFNEEKNLLDFSNTRKILVHSAPPSTLTSNMLSDSTRFYVSYDDSSLISTFKQKQKQLSPADTLVLLIRGNTAKDSTSTILTHTGKIDSLLNNSTN